MNKQIFKFQIESHISLFHNKSMHLSKYLEDFINGQDDLKFKNHLDPNYQYQQDIKMIFEKSEELKREEKIFKSKLPQIVNNAIIVSSFSLFEYCYKKLANTVWIHWENKGTKNIEWNSIDDYKTTIYNITNYNFNHLEGYWGKICSFRRIRNLIVHHGSTVRRNVRKRIEKQPDYDHLKKHKKIKLSEETGYFTIRDPSIVNDFFDNANKYLKGISKIFNENVYPNIKG